MPGPERTPGSISGMNRQADGSPEGTRDRWYAPATEGAATSETGHGPGVRASSTDDSSEPYHPQFTEEETEAQGGRGSRQEVAGPEREAG